MAPHERRFVDTLKPMEPTSAQQIKKAAIAGPPARKPALAEAIAPGKERWTVKTGTDADASKVGKSDANGNPLTGSFVDTTVEEMRTFKRAPDMPPVTSLYTNQSPYWNHRAAPTETTVWRLQAIVTEAKLESDGDYHLVLKSPTSNQTIIGEIPDPTPAFVKNTEWLPDIAAARAAMNSVLGKPLAAVGFPTPTGPPTTERYENAKVTDPKAGMMQIGKKATIIGVGFFDNAHGQDGVAPQNAIELHPILRITFP